MSKAKVSKAKSAADKPIEKPLCDWSKRDLKEHFEQLSEIVRRPRYACPKCGRAAGARKWLCKAKSID